MKPPALSESLGIFVLTEPAVRACLMRYTRVAEEVLRTPGTGKTAEAYAPIERADEPQT